jgi:aspartyl protease family protein
MGSKALLVIQGQPVTLSAGESRHGVTLRSIEGGRARVEWAGRVSELTVGGAPARVGAGGPGPGSGRRIVLAAGSGGHFMTPGSINGRTVQFMVDTGATTIALGAADARRVGLDLQGAQRVMMQTAGGNVPAQALTLTAVTVGDVTVANVQAVVMPTDMPFVLLGNSFLSRFQMRRDNDVLQLELR